MNGVFTPSRKAVYPDPQVVARLAGAAGDGTEYIIEGQGDAWGVESYPSFDDAMARLAALAAWEWNPSTPYPAPQDRYHKSAIQFDPEDDRILVWEVLPTGHRRVVWHFSGWHWSSQDFCNQDGSIMEQGCLPGHDRPLYEEVMDEDNDIFGMGDDGFNGYNA